MLFTRTGQPASRTFLNDKGKPATEVQAKCTRCGGAGGADKWKHTGWNCFDCGGSGNGPLRTVPVYTAEKLAAMNAAQAKRDAARSAKIAAAVEAAKLAAVAVADAARVAYPDLFAADTANPFVLDIRAKAEAGRSLSAAQVDAARAALARDAAPRSHVGTIGERRDFTAKVVFVASYETAYGRLVVNILSDADGNAIVYKGANCLGDKGETVTFKATVKAHDDRDGKPQTIVARPKLA